MILKYTFGFLGLITLLTWSAVFGAPSKNLKIIACDVGQGDAILVVQGSTQILVDGGPGSSVISCLEKYLPFWDRRIELVVLTHPQLDHYGGLTEVFDRFSVATFMTSPVNSSTKGYEVLKNKVGGSKARLINPYSGEKYRVGLIYLDVIWPERSLLGLSDLSYVLGAVSSDRDLNDYSVVLNLKYKEFDALLTGDIGPGVIGELIKTNLLKDVEYIKVPHHGSKNGLTEELLNMVKPEVAVISVGRNNRYGHPSEEVIKLLSDKEIKTLRSDEEGDVEIRSDGKKWWTP